MSHTVRPDWRAYLQSLGKELESQADRVRHLIGDRHWLSDGQHKEAILRALLRPHLPDAAIVTRGFVLDSTPELAPSQEQDILLVDTSASAPLFSTPDLTITDTRGARCCISVKSTLRRSELRNSVRNLISVPKPPLLSRALPWLGAFFFATEPQFVPTSAYDDLVPLGRYLCSTASSGDNNLAVVATVDGLLFLLRHADGADKVSVRGYRTSLATAIFVASAIDRLSIERGDRESILGRLAEDFEADPLSPPEKIISASEPPRGNRRRKKRSGRT
jgi:hypothetical protein